MKRLAALASLALAAVAWPGASPVLAGAGEEALLERWAAADPDERRRLGHELERMERARRYSAARPVLVDFRGGRVPLAELFETVIEPALLTPPQPASARDLGLTEMHRDALAALEAVREAYAPPHPVRTGTLNLLLGYGVRALTARALPPALRLRFLHETARSVRALDGRVRPDARTAWLLHNRLLPSLLGLARRTREKDPLREKVSEVASLLYLPSLLDERAQALLAPLTRGAHTREVLVRFYRAGTLDDLGRVALARSVAARASDDPAFAAGAGPLLLELLTDPRVAPRERGTLIDVVLDRLAPVAVLRPEVDNLLAVAFGGPPRALAEYREERKRRAGGVARPTGKRLFRFLSVVLLQDRDGAPPVVARVVRADLRPYEPLYADDGLGGRRFIGTLVPDAQGAHADFLGPPPGLSTARDNRLLRRRLRAERTSIETFGARGEVIELCVALPEDASEPVPRHGATLGQVVALAGARLNRTTDKEERLELVRLLLRLGTAGARALAVRHADSPGALAALIPLVEQGDLPAARVVLARLGELDLGGRARALAAVLAARNEELRREVEALCRDEAAGVAALAADALLAVGDAAGVPLLLGHPDKYARGCGAALALRLTPLAGSLKVVPARPPDFEKLAALAGKAFSPEDGAAWVRLGRFTRLALVDPDKVRQRRLRHKPLYLGERSVLGWEFADTYARAVAEGKARELWPALVNFLLDPYDPGAGILKRHLDPLLDALEVRAKEPPLRRVWVDGLVVLACAQYGIEMDAAFLDVAHERLLRVAGPRAPQGARRKAGVYWPIWAQREARR